MTTEPWTEPVLNGGASLSPWALAQEKQADEIEREALRYCPEFPFKPAQQETFIKKLSCYEDYQLVRLAPSIKEPSTEPLQEVYGLWAAGDFHPIDGFGNAFEKVNKIAPLIETPDALLEYVLTRLRFELPHVYPHVDAVSQLVQRKVDPGLADSLVRTCGTQAVLESVRVYEEQTNQVPEHGPKQFEIVLRGKPVPSPQDMAVGRALAEIVSDKEHLKEFENPPVENLLIKPQLDVIQVGGSDTAEPHDLTQNYDVRAAALLCSADDRCRLMQISVQVGPRGALSWNSVTLELSPLTRAVKATLPPVAIRTLRSRTAIQIPHWYLLDDSDSEIESMPPTLRAKLGNKSKGWRTTLTTKYGVGRSSEVGSVIVRAADLSFYKTFCLLEVHERLAESYRRSYALVRWYEDRFDIRPLNGTSPILHQIHADDEKPAIDKYANDYLRFFCWAVHGEGGPFYIPYEFREVPLAVTPGPEGMQKIRQLCSTTDARFPIKEVSADEAAELGYPDTSGARKSAVVVYQVGVFEAWFSIEPTGMIEMVRDLPVIENLSLETELYGQGDLFVLGSLSHSSANNSPDRPAAHHYIEDSKQSDGSGNAPDTATTLEQEIAQRGSVSDREVDTQIVLDDNSFPEDEISENN